MENPCFFHQPKIAILEEIVRSDYDREYCFFHSQSCVTKVSRDSERYKDIHQSGTYICSNTIQK